jgi:hypothetical protein
VSNKKKIQADGRTAATPRSVEESSDESEVEHPMTIRSRGQAEYRRPARAPVQDAGRPIRTPRRSLSDVVDDIYGPRSDYVYQPLKDDEIRLLTLYPGIPGQEMMCSLVVERLQASRQYQALSYRWGEDVPNKPIMILSYKSASKPKSLRDFKGSKLYTRSNLFEALQQLRHPEHEITLYVNALCINHDNLNEKYPQASRTQEIFNRASNVIVWLGTEKATSRTAFKFIPKVLDMNDFDKLVKEESNNQCWDALAELMRNPLFSRRWLIQELAVARNAVLHCGPHTIQWSDFSDAVALFEANLPEIQRYSKFSLASGGPINDIRALGASTLVSVVNHIIRKRPDGKILYHIESAETLVSMLAVFEATDPLDTIIAVMGLARDHAQVQSIIDVKKKGILDNYIDFVGYCALSSGSIDIICRHWAPVMKEKISTYRERNRAGVQSTKVQLPSWIPNVSGSAFGAPEDKDKDKQSGRVNGDSFVGLPDHRIYNAAFSFPPRSFTFGVHAQNNPNIVAEYSRYDGTMTLRGYSLGPIAEIGPRAVKGIIQEECLDMGGWIPGSPTVPERLWRTLVADRGPNNTEPPSWYHRACLHCLEQCGTNGDIDTTAILNQPKCSHIVADFLRRVQSVIWNRRCILSKVEINGDRLFGLAPGGTKVGDMICILFGCSVPVILREHITLDDHYFEVIGESFVYGMMAGEARQGLLDAEIEAKTTTFKLR